MEKLIHFYQDLTQIAENRIKELIQDAENMEARWRTSLGMDSYLRSKAVLVYLTWRELTAGWHIQDDLERLKSLAHGIAWTA